MPLILGASSLVGQFLLPALQDAGQTVFGVGRRRTGPGAVVADLTAPDLVRQLPTASLVFSAAPLWLLPGALDALASKGMTRLVAFSSTSRFTKDASPDVQERAVAEKLAKAETAIMAFCQARDIGWTLLRPTLIYAEGQDQNISRLAHMIRKIGILPIAGAGQGLRQPVHAQDLAAIAIVASQTSAAINTAYNLPGGETLTYRAMAERVFESMGRRPRIVSIPLPLWQLGLRLALPILPGATAAMGARMAQDLVFDDSQARSDLDWQPRRFAPRFQTS